LSLDFDNSTTIWFNPEADLDQNHENCPWNKTCDKQRAAILCEIIINWSAEHKNISDSLHFNLRFNSNEIDKKDSFRKNNAWKLLAFPQVMVSEIYRWISCACSMLYMQSSALYICQLPSKDICHQRIFSRKESNTRLSRAIKKVSLLFI
jgi:hypothetical protein